MLTINFGAFEDVLEAFMDGDYTSAMFVVESCASARDMLTRMDGWKVNLRSLSATKGDKKVSFIFTKEHTYGRIFDYMGVMDRLPDKNDFLYYVTRLREPNNLRA